VIPRRAIAAIVAGVLATTGAIVAPAFGATEQARAPRPSQATAPSRFSGSFTPAAADPRLAAAFARSGLGVGGFRFTPAESRRDKRAVTVAVRARSTNGATAAFDTARIATGSAATVGMAPIAYNLGVAVGWKRFAVSGSVAKVDLATRPGSREAADLAVSYNAGRLSSRLVAAADRPLAGSAKLVEDVPSYSVDMSSSYSLTRNLDVTAGLRYQSDRERLAQLKDDRRDSQAVYVGTAFRF
jgi:hypothetical protein